MDARTYVISYVAQNPEMKDKVLDCIATGLDWNDIEAIIRIALS